MLTLAMIESIRDYMQSCAIKPRTIETQEQADAMTASDPFEMAWSVGDKFYVANTAPDAAFVAASAPYGRQG